MLHTHGWLLWDQNFLCEDRKKPAINVTGTLELVSFEKKQVAKVGRHFLLGLPVDVFFQPLKPYSFHSPLVGEDLSSETLKTKELIFFEVIKIRAL